MVEGKRPSLVGIDSPWSWAVAVATAWTYVWLMIVLRSSGVFFLAMINTFGTTRGQTAWSFSLMNSIAQLIGPVAGLMTRRFNTRTISLVGTISGSFALLLTYFLYDIVWITVLMGGILGAGLGLVTTVNCVMMNQVFRKYRSSGSGVSCVGGSIGSIIFPPIMLVLIDSYGLRGALLITAGLTFNSIAGSLLLRRPPWMVTSAPRRPINRLSQHKQHSKSSIDKIDDDTFYNSLLDIGEEVTVFERNSSLKGSRSNDGSLKRRPAEASRIAGTMGFQFLKKPVFYLICFGGIGNSYANVIIMVTIVDFAVGQNVSEQKSVLLLSLFAVGDICGRLLSGWISDKQLLQRKHMMAVNSMIMCVLFHVLSTCTSYPLMVFLTLLFGWCVGSSLILFPIILTEFLGLDNLPISFGVFSFITGIATIIRPFLIRVYRDDGGTYSGLYNLNGGLCLVIAVCWCVETILSKVMKNRAKKKMAQSAPNDDSRTAIA